MRIEHNMAHTMRSKDIINTRDKRRNTLQCHKEKEKCDVHT